MVSFTDEDVIQTLLSNLRNAAATFGEDSAHFQELREMVHEHLGQMNQASASHSSDSTRNSSSSQGGKTDPGAPPQAEKRMLNLAFRPKPSS
ncbi:MAG: hypothetical protein M1821_000366 [Bathelium mastoideum]|nr:MAG: hypothetical protein M1821_000366 [Bathelium mastoideum]